MDIWPGYFNIINHSNNIFVLGDSVDEDTARRWMVHLKGHYPNANFEVVQVDFAHPRWYQEKFEDHMGQDCLDLGLTCQTAQRTGS